MTLEESEGIVDLDEVSFLPLEVFEVMFEVDVIFCFLLGGTPRGNNSEFETILLGLELLGALAILFAPRIFKLCD